MVDVTPSYPIRLMGYGSRTTESEGIASPLKVRALAIGDDAKSGEDAGPAVLITVDNCHVGAFLTDEVARRLQAKAKIRRERSGHLCHAHSLRACPGQRDRLHLRQADPGRPESTHRSLHPGADRCHGEGGPSGPCRPRAGQTVMGPGDGRLRGQPASAQEGQVGGLRRQPERARRSHLCRCCG